MSAPTSMKIAHVLGSLHTGGAERVALLCVERLVKLGHQVTVVSLEDPKDGPLAREFDASGARIARIPKRPGSYDRGLSVRLLSFFVRERFDVVHTHNPPPLTYAALPARLSGARVIHTKHGPHPDSFARVMLRRVGAASTNSFVAVSQATADFSQQLYEVVPWKLRVILNGTDLDRFHPDAAARARTRSALGIPDDAFVFGTVGRMAAVKNQALMVRAAAPLLGPRVRLVIVGGGAEAEPVKKLVAELNVTAFVHLPGETPKVAEHLAAFDAFVLSSDSEGLPLSLAEAMATSLPMVCTSVGGVPLVVDEGETGFLVPAKEETLLRAAMKRFCDQPDLARLMGKRAMEVAHARYSADRMMRQYLELYGAPIPPDKPLVVPAAERSTAGPHSQAGRGPGSMGPSSRAPSSMGPSSMGPGSMGPGSMGPGSIGPTSKGSSPASKARDKRGN